MRQAYEMKVGTIKSDQASHDDDNAWKVINIDTI